MKSVAVVPALLCVFALLLLRWWSGAAPSGVSHLGLVVAEIMYQPLPPSEAEKSEGFVDSQAFEFIEITNITAEPVPLNGMTLNGAVTFAAGDLGNLILEPLASAVLVADNDAFALRYPGAGPILGQFAGHLPDSGGRLIMSDGVSPELTIAYGTGNGWPKTPRGMGFSLVLKTPTENPDHNVPAQWRASAEPGGSPGEPDPDPDVLPVYINEILPRTEILDTYYRVAAYPTGPAQAPTAFIQSYVEDMRADPYRFSFIHLVAPDLTGHLYGWGSPQQDEAIKAVDVDLGEILALIDEDPRLTNQTVVILTTDHGGGGGEVLLNHIDNTEPLNYTIPFYVWGPGIPAGTDLYDLNADTRLRPDAETHPPYSLDTGVMPIRNGDLGNLALDLLGYPPIPGSWINHDQSLKTQAEGVEHVIAISVDGLRPDSIRRLGPEALPHLHRLRGQGAVTDEARTDTLTYTNPNHTTMLTGRGTFDLSPTAKGHRVTFNSDVPTTLHDWNGGAYIASLFDVLHAFGASSAFYSNKVKLDFLGRSYGAIDGDIVELYNPNPISVNVSGWGLTDDPDEPGKFTIPEGTYVPGHGGYLLIHEDPGVISADRPRPLEGFFGSVFGLSPAGGELHLFSMADGKPTGFDTGTAYGGVLSGASLGRLESDDGYHYGMTRTPTPGNANTAWFSSPLAVTEFHLSAATPDLGFVELRNVGSTPLMLGPNWGVRGRFTYTFPEEEVNLPPGGIVLLATDPSALQAAYALPDNVLLLGPLVDTAPAMSSETDLEIVFSNQPLSRAAHVAVLENFAFGERTSWIPPDAPSGHSLQRRNPRTEAALPDNWRLSEQPGGTPGAITTATYDDWRQRQLAGLDPVLSDPLADPDGDGSLNLEEYGFGTDPLDRLARHEPAITRTGPPRDRLIELRYQRPIDIADVAYEAQVSSDMNSWRNVTPPFLEASTRTALTGGLEEVLFIVYLPAEARYMRLHLEMLP